MKSFFPQVRAECIHVRNVEDYPPPASHRTTLFQIEDGTLSVVHPERGEIPVFSAVDDFHAEHISVEPATVMLVTLSVTAEIFSIFTPRLTSHLSSPQTKA
jgi:hypothetical protein